MATETQVRTLIREVVYLDPDTGHSARFSLANDSPGNNRIVPTDDGVYWTNDGLYTFVPWHRVFIVREYYQEQRDVEGPF